MSDVSRRTFLKGVFVSVGSLVLAGCRAMVPPIVPTPTRSLAPRATAVPGKTLPAAPAAGEPAPTATRRPSATPEPPTPTATPLPPLEYPIPVVRRDEWGARPPNHDAWEERGFFD